MVPDQASALRQLLCISLLFSLGDPIQFGGHQLEFIVIDTRRYFD